MGVKRAHARDADLNSVPRREVVHGNTENTNTPFRLDRHPSSRALHSIGWGIRGNYGHEYGAMLAGTLSAIAICLIFGRPDWHKRVVYFALFGAIGWGFGGSMSYMQVVGYTHSGHLASQLYGFFGVFVLGFLWAAPGGGGTALPAVLDRDRLTQIFKPMCWVFAVWTLFYFGEEALTRWYEATFWESEGYTKTWFRQKSPFYWLDSDWLQCLLTIVTLCAFDLWDRRFEKGWMLGVFATVGALLGLWFQTMLHAFDLTEAFEKMFVRYQGDTSLFAPEDLLTNWPQFFSDISGHLGWVFGLLFGCGLYFSRYGKWRSGSDLLLHLALGWYACFLLLPVLLGIRMTPPRGDDWAGVLGVVIGGLVYFKRNNLLPAAYAMVVSGIVGGLGFVFTQCLKLLLTALGNPEIVSDENTLVAWKHWQSTNWHSLVIEQGVGIFYGLGVGIALWHLARSAKRVEDDPPVRRWTEAFSVFFLLNVLLYVNLVKNVEDFLNGRAAVPEKMKMPLFESIEFSLWGWFNIHWLAITLCTVALLVIHLKRRIEMVPRSGIGKGQLLYLIFLWAMVIGNYMKALAGFSENRLVTEGLIFINATIVTFLILACVRSYEGYEIRTVANYGPFFRRTVAIGTIAAILAVLLATAGVRSVYGDHFTGHAGMNKRFGPEANWRVAPILKNKEHR